MNDIHNHILFSLDDGAKTIEDSITLLKKAQKDGIKEMVLTPHYIKGTDYAYNNQYKLKIFNELKERATNEEINIQLYIGNEVYADEGIPDLIRDGEIMTINNSRYVLIEFPLHNEDKRAGNIIFEIVSNGYIPIIAHPERYDYIKDDPSRVDEYLDLGALLQCDYLCLTGKYGKRAKKTIEYLIKEEKVFVLGSDVHKTTEDFKVKKAQKKIYKLLKKNDRKYDILINQNFDQVIRNIDTEK